MIGETLALIGAALACFAAALVLRGRKQPGPPRIDGFRSRRAGTGRGLRSWGADTDSEYWCGYQARNSGRWS